LLAGCDQETTTGPAGLDDVQALFAKSCAGSLCHIGYSDQPAGLLDLSPGQECDDLVGVPALEDPDQVRVQPGSSEESFLLCKLLPDCDRRQPGSSLMPLGSSTGLPESDLALVAAWIDGGAPGCAGADASPPSFAGAVSATAYPSAIGLAWEPASDDASSPAEIVYLVYQAESPGAQDFGQPVAITEPGATSHVVGGLPISTTFYYVVRARDAAGNVDQNTVEVSVTTPDVADESPPTFAGVTAAIPVGSLSASLSWEPASDDVTPESAIRYRVYVATEPGGQNFTDPWIESPGGAAEIVATGLSAVTDYYFVVRAIDQSGNEDSNTIEMAVTTGDAVRFSADIEPILSATCAAMACHGGPFPAEGLNLQPGSAHAALVGVLSTQCPDRALVAPSAPGASYLVNKLTGVDICFGTRMPKIGSLSPIQIQLVIDWITEGALDN
jgi:hypothetical protein